MPTYIFKNKKSKEVFEIQMRISELDDYKLKNPNLIQMPTAPSFRLKGTGWYETDFKTGKKKNIAIKDSDKSDEKKAIEKKGIKEKEGKKEVKKEVKETKDEK